MKRHLVQGQNYISLLVWFSTVKQNLFGVVVLYRNRVEQGDGSPDKWSPSPLDICNTGGVAGL